VPDQTLARQHFAGAPPARDAAIAWIAGRQHGVVTTAQLLAEGSDNARIARAVAAGRLHRVYRGVYAVGHRGLSREGRWMAGVLAAGERAALSHLCAAALRAIRELRTDFVTVLAPKARRPKGPLRVYECRNLDPRDVTVWRGIPVTTVARTFVDLTDVLDAYELANVIYEADYLGLFDVAETWETMGRANGRHNLHVLEQALAINATGSAGTKSRRENAALRRARLAGLPEPLVNVKLEGIEVDQYWPQWRLVVEVDGPGHRRARAKRMDAAKEAVLRAAGYDVVRVSGADEIVQAIRNHLRTRGCLA
jgi:very-short-patch-repair endonuclease